MADLSDEALPKQESHAKVQACRTQDDACNEPQHRDDSLWNCERPHGKSNLVSQPYC